jgi:uncharacterized membrane protein YhaH (DUF805 family)
VVSLAPQGPSAPPPNWGGSTVTSTPGQHSFAASPVNFGEAMRRALTLWTIRGRASRSEFWWWTLGSSLVYVASSMFLSLLGDAGSLITSLGSLFITVVSFKISIRRYHDVGKGGGTLAGILGGSFVGGVLLGVGIGLTGVAIYNGTAEEEAIGSYLPIMGVGALILVAFSIWNLIILCQPGKPERNRFDA